MNPCEVTVHAQKKKKKKKKEEENADVRKRAIQTVPLWKSISSILKNMFEAYT